MIRQSSDHAKQAALESECQHELGKADPAILCLWWGFVIDHRPHALEELLTDHPGQDAGAKTEWEENRLAQVRSFLHGLVEVAHLFPDVLEDAS
jgi:hypothetical protein